MDLHMREMSEIGKFMGWHQVENHNEVRDLTEENLEVRFPGPSQLSFTVHIILLKFYKKIFLLCC